MKVKVNVTEVITHLIEIDVTLENENSSIIEKENAVKQFLSSYEDNLSEIEYLMPGVRKFGRCSSISISYLTKDMLNTQVALINIYKPGENNIAMHRCSRCNKPTTYGPVLCNDCC